MSAASVLARGRDAAEALMVDACTIVETLSLQTDDLTGQVARNGATLYSGRCRIQTAGRSVTGRREDAGDASVVMLRLEVHLPVVGSEDITRGCVVTVTSAVNDTELGGRTFRVHDVAHKSFATARRLQVEEVT